MLGCRRGLRSAWGSPIHSWVPLYMYLFALLLHLQQRKLEKRYWGGEKQLHVIYALFFSPCRKEQLDPAARYVCDHESSSSHHCVGTEGPAVYDLGPLGSRAGHEIRVLGLTAVAGCHFPLPISC